ncbi:MAG: hypothetical protein KDA59_24865, partial [Planctomycetales bacterium]|nr:hypothetical protein [Planctomycetales bacterium]
MYSMFQRGSQNRNRPVRGVTTTGLLLGMTALIAVAAVAIDYALLVARKTEANAVAEATALAGAQV